MNSHRQKKLENLLDQEEGLAIAITGAWGVGKTHFWNDFIEHYRDKLGKRKYAYVSVFGVESLADLKALIVEKIGSDAQADRSFFEKTTKSIKSVAKEFKTANIQGFTFGGSLLFSILFSRISDAVVCIDDMERKSAKLDIRDIMGLVDFLKSQRNCKVVVLLNDGKDESGFYAEYKEKVFDDILIIKDISDALTGLLEEELPVVKEEFLRFYGCFKLENIRFYKKALRVFKSIYRFLPEKRPESAVKQIVQSTLVFLAITDLDEKTLDLSWDDLGVNKNNFLNYSDKEFSEIKEIKEKDSVKVLKDFYGGNLILTEWDALLKRFFLQESESRLEDDFRALAQSDLLSEESILAQNKLSSLLDGFYNFEVGIGFEQRLKDLAQLNFDNQGLSNSMFYIRLLEKCGSINLSENLKEKLMSWVQNKILTASRPIESAAHFFMFGSDGCEDVYQEIEEMIKQNKWPNYSLTDTMKFYIKNSASRSFDAKVILESTKEDWQKFIFEDTQEERFSVIKEAWNQSICPEKNPEIRQWIRELMIEKRQESVAMGVAVDHMLGLLDKKSPD